jgi:DNA-binding MurR/RpiR family transcriptional regulator
LAQAATNLLLARSDMASFVDSLTAPMSLINALIVGVTMKRRQEVEKRLGELEQIWDEYQVYDKQDGGRADV